jgi:hypothetical protein
MLNGISKAAIPTSPTISSQTVVGIDGITTITITKDGKGNMIVTDSDGGTWYQANDTANNIINKTTEAMKTKTELKYAEQMAKEYANTWITVDKPASTSGLIWDEDGDGPTPGFITPSITPSIVLNDETIERIAARTLEMVLEVLDRREREKAIEHALASQALQSVDERQT